MIKLKELINEQVKPGDAFQSVGGNVDVIIDKFMGGKWKFNIQGFSEKWGS